MRLTFLRQALPQRSLLLAGTAAVVMAAWAPSAVAQSCSINTGGRGPSSGILYQGYNGAAFNIRVAPRQTSIPVPVSPVAGEVLFSTTETFLPTFAGGALGQAVPLRGCPAGVIERFDGIGTLYNSASNLYLTNIPGIAYRVYYVLSDQQEIAAPYTTANPHHRRGALVFPVNGHSAYTNVRTRIDFVATGDPISPGTIQPASVGGRSSVVGAGIALPSQLYNVRLSQPITLTLPTCSVSNSAALNIRMPDITTAQLMQGDNTVHSTDLNVACSGQALSPPTLTITANQAISQSPAVLRNQTTGTTAASNVGIKLWLFSESISDFVSPALNSRINNAGISISGAIPTNLWRFRLGASYQKLSDIVKAGLVSGQATLTFSYS